MVPWEAHADPPTPTQGADEVMQHFRISSTGGTQSTPYQEADIPIGIQEDLVRN